jgi:uncharacterized Tic20 family protein
MQAREDERTLAALAHAGIIANSVSLAGLIGAALIWTTQRERSDFIRRHAHQALAFQIVMLLLLLLLGFVWGACLIFSIMPVLLRPELFRDSPPPLFMPVLFSGVILLILGGIATIFGLIGALQAYRGLPFRYPIVGRLLRDSQTSEPPAAIPPTTPPPAPPVAAEPLSTAPPPTAEAPAAPAFSNEAPLPTVPPNTAPPPTVEQSLNPEAPVSTDQQDTTRQ